MSNFIGDLRLRSDIYSDVKNTLTSTYLYIQYIRVYIAAHDYMQNHHLCTYVAKNTNNNNNIKQFWATAEEKGGKCKNSEAKSDKVSNVGGHDVTVL